MIYHDAVVKMLIAVTSLLLDHKDKMTTVQKNALQDVRAQFIL